jgi:glutamate racemase
MKTLVLALVVACGAAAPSAADKVPAKPTQDVVDVAKSAKAKRKKSTSKVLTNADVKKAKGNVVESTAKQKPIDTTPEPSLVDQQEAMRKARATHGVLFTAAQAEVESLEKELATLEQQYYEENDLDRRDSVLVRRFDETKKKLDAARATLAELIPE